MDHLTRIIFDYLHFARRPTLEGLEHWIVKLDPKRRSWVEVNARLGLLQRHFESKEQYEQCQSIQLILTQFTNETTNIQDLSNRG